MKLINKKPRLQAESLQIEFQLMNILNAFRPNINRKETVRVLALIEYTIMALEEKIEALERESCSDFELLRGMYTKLDEAKERAKYFRELLRS